MALVLGGCAVQPPTAPTVMALPPPGKSLAAFQQDDYACRNFAQQRTSYAAANVNSTNPTANGAVLGTLAGAALGAGLGAVAGNAGAGAAICGATGLIGGTSVGANRAAGSQYSLQQQYDIAYTQCMYAHGDSVRSPPPGYAYGGAYPYPAAYPGYYPYGPYAYGPGYYGPGFYGPDVIIGGGWGGGWGNGHWGHGYGGHEDGGHH
jgi:hypothetical protein